jgi:hypothetical protein
MDTPFIDNNKKLNDNYLNDTNKIIKKQTK